MTLRTIENKPILTVNGIQTMSHDYLNLIGELADLQTMGVTRFRLSPHSCDMVAVAAIFRDVLDHRTDWQDAAVKLEAMKFDAPFSNGFYYQKPGNSWNRTASH
jgi:collagenase-like PrtC family protease